MEHAKHQHRIAANDNDSDSATITRPKQLAFDFSAPASTAPPVAPPEAAALPAAGTAPRPKRRVRTKSAARIPVVATEPVLEAAAVADEPVLPRPIRRALQSLAPRDAKGAAELVKELMERIYAAAVSSFDAAEIDPSDRVSARLAKDGAALANALCRLGVTLARLEDILAKRAKAA